MEEDVGLIWHKWISKIAHRGYPDARVELDDIRNPLAIFFRAMGGDGALRITEVSQTKHGAKRSLLQRLAGANETVELAWRDQDTLRLPRALDCLPTTELNRHLYFWLAALASLDDTPYDELNWIQASQAKTLAVLERYPGLAARYQQLVEAHLLHRPDPAKLKGRDQQAEIAIRQALSEPGSIDRLPLSEQPANPVLLWLHPFPPQAKTALSGQPEQDNDDDGAGEGKIKQGSKRRHQVEQAESPEEKTGALLAMRHETDIFSLSEMIKMNVAPDDSDDLSNADQMADDLDYLTITRDNKTVASRIKFDLDLPSSEDDDIVLNDGKLFPEWDYKKKILVKDHCRLVPMVSKTASPMPLPEHLRKAARKLQRQFESLTAKRQWVRGLEDGSELDLEAYINYRGERATGHAMPTPALYKQMLPGHRDLATLVLADLSLSTEASLNESQQVIDVIRDAMFLFSESLRVTADSFGLYGFSSKKRDMVRFTTIKGFEDKYDNLVRGHIQAIKPGLFTRMGGAIRQATEILARQPNQQRLLLLLTDGKPNDLDKYEGRYGIEDTRQAIIEAKQAGLLPFCITIDSDAEDYLPYLFGSNGYTRIKDAAQLPQELPMLYAQLTQLY